MLLTKNIITNIGEVEVFCFTGHLSVSHSIVIIVLMVIIFSVVTMPKFVEQKTKIPDMDIETRR